jgi:hypothetical protein
MVRIVVLLGVFMAGLVPAASSSAGLILEFVVDGTPQTAIGIAGPGQSVDVQVNLRQTGPLAVDEPDLQIDGLALAGVRVSFGNPAGIAEVSSIDENPAFNDGAAVKFINLAGSVAELNEGVLDLFFGPYVTADANGRILLGTFRFTGLATGVTSISVEEFSTLPEDDDFFTGAATVLDDFGIAPGSATLTVTPEPGAMGLSLAVLGAIAAARRYRARRRREPSVTS